MEPNRPGLPITVNLEITDPTPFTATFDDVLPVEEPIEEEPVEEEPVEEESSSGEEETIETNDEEPEAETTTDSDSSTFKFKGVDKDEVD